MINNKIQSLYDLFTQQLLKNPDSKFLFDKINSKWRGLTLSEINNKVRSIQFYLQKKNVKKGDRIFLLSSSRSEWFLIDIAIQSMGAITVPSFTTNNISDNKFIIEDSKPKIIFIENDEIFKKNRSIFKKKFITEKIIIDDSKYETSFKDILSYDEKIDLPKIKRSDISSIIYTSGTSGNPKGVILSHKSIIHNCIAAFELLKEINFKNEKFLSFLPLSHSYERMAGLYFPLYINGQIYFCKKMENILSDFKEVNPTIVTAVPRFYENIYKKIYLNIKKSNKILQSFFEISLKNNFDDLSLLKKSQIKIFYFFLKRKIKNIFGHNFKTFVSGGAALDPKISNLFKFLDIEILQGYGQTEAGPLISCNNLKNNNPLTVGFPIMGTKVKTLNTDEIVVKGPNVMNGYWRNKKLSDEVLKNGWLHTGDLGCFDKYGRLIINGRKKDLIVTSGGENISPQKIENYFRLYTEILHTVVFGDSKPFLICIFSVERGVKKSRISRIVDEVNKSLNSVEKIRKFLVAEEPFTYENNLLTQTFKVKKKEVYLKYEKLIKGFYSKL